MKKTIKLNENNLTRMITEAINNLDWKTYANTARNHRAKYQNNRDEFDIKHYKPIGGINPEGLNRVDRHSRSGLYGVTLPRNI